MSPNSVSNKGTPCARSVAAQRGRSEGRATARHERFRRAADHESGAGPRQAPPQTPGEIAERMETFQALAEGIGKLQEPYASAIYLRFVEELSVAEVAKRQSVPVPTAATRIRRGLELLREQMRGRFGESWKARCLVFAPPATTAAVPPVIAGAIAMTTKTKFLAAAAVLALAIPVYSVLTAPGDLVEEGRDPAAVEAQLPSAPEPMSVVEAPAAGAAERSEVEASSATADTSTDPRALRVVVRDASTLEPVKDAVVWYFDRASEKDRDWNRERKGGSSGKPAKAGTGRPSATTRYSRGRAAAKPRPPREPAAAPRRTAGSMRCCRQVCSTGRCRRPARRRSSPEHSGPSGPAGCSKACPPRSQRSSREWRSSSTPWNVPARRASRLQPGGDQSVRRAYHLRASRAPAGNA